jgi:GntR family transcriptional regulator/MocR family aminotransferase
MSRTWANSLDLHLDARAPRIRAAVEDALREAVTSGRLPAGTRLPPTRALAADLGVARNTVADAYAQLVAEGWLEALVGSGTWVADRHVVEPPSPSPPSGVPRTVRYDLRSGEPDLGLFPRRAWLAAARAVLREMPDRLLGYPDPRGVPELRVALAGYLGRARGVSVDPDRIVVCAGMTHALAVLGRLLRARGAESVAVEGYGHLSHHGLIERQGLRPVPLPVDANGARPGDLGGVSAALLTPAHQFPLGVTLHPERRRAFVDWAVRSGGIVIEDDYDGEFRYDRQPVGAMQALAPEHVVYAGTASKSLAPGLRLGWLVVPGALRDELIEVKEASGATTSSLDQLTLAQLIASGGYDRQVRAARLRYRRRRDRLVSTLGRRVPGVSVRGISAGLQALVELRPDLREREVIARARERGLALDGLEGYTAIDERRDRGALVVGYTRPPEHAYTTALARLCAALAEGGS